MTNPHMQVHVMHVLQVFLPPDHVSRAAHVSLPDSQSRILGLAERISEYYSNTYTYFTAGMNASLAKPVDWLERQDRWAQKQVIPLHSPANFQSATVPNILQVRALSLDPGFSASAPAAGASCELPPLDMHRTFCRHDIAGEGAWGGYSVADAGPGPDTV